MNRASVGCVSTSNSPLIHVLGVPKGENAEDLKICREIMPEIFQN